MIAVDSGSHQCEEMPVFDTANIREGKDGGLCGPRLRT